MSKVILIAMLLIQAGCGKPGKSPFTISAASKPAEPEEVWPKKPVAAALPDLLPLAKGSIWQIKATTGTEIHRLVLKALGEEERGGIKASFIETSLDGKKADVQGYVVDSRGIRLAAQGPNGSFRIDPPMPVIKLPPVAGQSWKWKGKYVSGEAASDGSASFTMSGPEPVKTGAGDLEAWRVDGTLTILAGDAARVITNTQWFAPGVGLVKQLTIGEGEQDRLAVLTSYKIAGQ